MKARRFGAMLMRKCLYVTFNAWEADMREERRLRRAMRKISARWTNGSLVRVLYAWREDVVQERHHRVILARFGKKMRNQLANASFATWSWFRSERQRFRKLAFRIFGRVVSGKRAVAFELCYALW